MLREQQEDQFAQALDGFSRKVWRTPRSPQVMRYDLAIRSPAYVKELVTHHVGGYLKIAPEHTEAGPLSKMMKPGIGSYDKFKQLFEKYSEEAGKKQYLIPYFIAAHPGTTDEDMLNLALWLKKNNFRLDQVQTFLPTPMALATAMYHTEKNPLKKPRSPSTFCFIKNSFSSLASVNTIRFSSPKDFLISSGVIIGIRFISSVCGE